MKRYSFLCDSDRDGEWRTITTVRAASRRQAVALDVIQGLIRDAHRANRQWMVRSAG
jgi:hypothetical protein